MRVYLAGPVTNYSFTEATSWRKYAADELKAVGITAYSPLRAKQFLSHIKAMSPMCDNGENGLWACARGTMTRDRFDATRCDVLLANLLGTEEKSVGTIMEIAWADLARIPIVCAMEEGNPHEHAMINEAIGCRVGTLDEAIAAVKGILLP